VVGAVGVATEAAGKSPNEAQAGDPSAAPGSASLRLLAEDLSVETISRETGRVRVNLVTHSREEDIEVSLAHDTVELDRIAINRPIDSIPAVREEGDVTIVPVVEEVVTVHRQLMLKEELRIKRVHGTQVHRERVTLRSQEAVVARTPEGPLE
jgi:uncharacterized protein (TIGR02271 family)